MERTSRLFEALKQVLEDESSYKFELRDSLDKRTGVSYKQLVRKFDINSLPTILRLSLIGGFYDYYHLFSIGPIRNIDWEKDWKDNNPISIDYVEASSDNKLTVGTLGEFNIDYMAMMYYGVDEILFEPKDELYKNREDRMKIAKYVPAVVKDIEVALKIMNKVCADNGMNVSEFKMLGAVPLRGDLDFRLKMDFIVTSEFNIEGMREDDIIENSVKRAKVIREWRKEFREWLPSEQRKKFYESSKEKCWIYERGRRGWHVVRGPSLIKWPVKDREVRERLVDFYIHHYLFHGGYLFTFDGYAIVGYWVNKLNKYKFWIDRKEKKYRRLKPIPLEKMEFLKEDFPEMFK